jgi:hypothetical protein
MSDGLDGMQVAIEGRAAIREGRRINKDSRRALKNLVFFVLHQVGGSLQ